MPLPLCLTAFELIYTLAETEPRLLPCGLISATIFPEKSLIANHELKFELLTNGPDNEAQVLAVPLAIAGIDNAMVNDEPDGTVVTTEPMY